MMKSEEARQKVEAEKDPQWVASRMAAVKRLPGASEWMRRWVDDEDDELDEDAPPKPKTIGVSTYSDADRREFFVRMFPKLAEHLEAVWQRLPQTPYGGTYSYGGLFRAPHHALVVAGLRDDWIDRVVLSLAGHDPDPIWLATWAAHLGYNGVGPSASAILANAIDSGGPVGEQVFDILKQSATNQHEIGQMGDHVAQAFLMCQRTEAWDFVERLLLAAQRQEGLRQSILECARLGRPEAFRSILGIVSEHGLVRFASTVRTIDLWFGLMWDSISTKVAQHAVDRVITFLDDADARAAAIKGKDAESAYFALWCEAHKDAEVAAKKATSLLTHKSPEHRWVGVHVLAITGLPESAEPVSRMLEDADLRVAGRAMDGLSQGFQEPEGDPPPGSPEMAILHPWRRDTFDRFENLLGRIGKKDEKLKPLVWPWTRAKLTAEQVGESIVRFCTPNRSERLISLLGRFGTNERGQAARLIAGHDIYTSWEHRRKQTEKPPLTPIARTTLIALLGDASSGVRETAAELLTDFPITPDEAARHEELCQRSASDIRTRAIDRLLTQDDASAVASATRLLDKGKAAAAVGLEILLGMVQKDRAIGACEAAATAFRDSQPKLAKPLAATLDRILSARTATKVTHADAFGLAKPFTPRPLPTIRAFPRAQITPAAMECIWSLNDLVEANKTLELEYDKSQAIYVTSEDGGTLLGSLRYSWVFSPDIWRSQADDLKRNPVRSITEEWFRTRSASTRDSDGLELVRAWIAIHLVETESYPVTKTVWPAALRELCPKDRSGWPPHVGGTQLLIEWALRSLTQDTSAFWLDQIEGAIERDDIERRFDRHDALKRYAPSIDRCAQGWHEWYQACQSSWASLSQIEHIRRLDGLVRLADRRLTETRAGKKARNADEAPSGPWEVRSEEFVALWEAGDISDDELLMRVTRPDPRSQHDYPDVRMFSDLFRLRRPGKPDPHTKLRLTPRLDALLERIRRRVLEIELARGDAESPASLHALNMEPSGGVDAAIGALGALGKLRLVRGYIFNRYDKAASLSTIIKNSRPGEQDTPVAFAAAAKAAGLTDERLVELALYQPRWAAHVEATTGWAGLEAAALWMRRHTKEGSSEFSDDEAGQEAWEGRAAEMSPISPDSFHDGAVDRAWFERSYKQLGPKRWAVLDEAAKYASSGSGHTRARLFADTMLGKVSEKELTKRITTKRHQDAARALGLVALKPGEAGQKQILARFKTLQEMRRTSRKHGGSMLQASEKRAVEIGMENLAWTAGYPDPLRLQWAMEILELGDLAKGPVTVKVKDCTVTLSLDDDGVPSLVATKAGKPLKSIPPAVKKDKAVATLSDRATQLRRQSSRVRQTLEQSMCRGDTFEGSEITKLFGHPLLRTMLSRLVLTGTTKAGGTLIGYPDKGGKALRSIDGAFEPIKASDTLRIAHPLDFLAAKKWSQYQSECFRAERVQPFKQVFREVYVPVASELVADSKSSGDRSPRYAGQQVQPRQALALFGSRGWVARPEEGVQRTFHRERLTVHVEFEEGFYTPAEIDGLTLRGISFTKAASAAPVAIRDVPPRIFSEVLRDLDLVVSVAHRGGVDPEATHSTVEMRAALLRETATLLSLRNIRYEGQRAIIKGEFGEYALHLGSGTIHMLPGGTLWIIPVHSQHRGRLFLPFADNDPKTAEIISKAILLSRDREIQDPAILAQIRAG